MTGGRPTGGEADDGIEQVLQSVRSVESDKPVPPVEPLSAGVATAVTDPLTDLSFNADGLICAVAQQFDTREVLMVAWMDAEAVRRTLSSRCATYWSRSRRQYWVKGETSGHSQRVVEVRKDCDGDTLLLLVDQTGAACHTGSRTCFDDGLLTS